MSEDVIVSGIYHKETGDIFDVNIVGQKQKNLYLLARDYNKSEGSDKNPFGIFRFDSIGVPWDLRNADTAVVNKLNILRLKYLIYSKEKSINRLQSQLNIFTNYNSELETLSPEFQQYIKTHLDDDICEMEDSISSAKHSIDMMKKSIIKLNKELENAISN